MSDPYIAWIVGLLCGLVMGTLIMIPANRKGRYYYDDK